MVTIFRATIDPTLSGVTLMADSSNSAEKIRVLYIGSDEDYFSDGYLPISSPIKKYLENYSAEIGLMEAKTGEEGISKANTLDPQIILIHAYLTDMNTHEVVRSIRETNTLSKIITMSMSNNPDFIVSTIEAGADHYASLPIMADDNFYAMIRNLYNGMGNTLRDQWIELNSKNNQGK